MAETRRKFDNDFKQGAIRLVRESDRPTAEAARELGVNAGEAGQLGQCRSTPPGEPPGPGQ